MVTSYGLPFFISSKPGEIFRGATITVNDQVVDFVAS